MLTCHCLRGKIIIQKDALHQVACFKVANIRNTFYNRYADEPEPRLSFAVKLMWLRLKKGIITCGSYFLYYETVLSVKVSHHGENLLKVS